ncbi:MAG: substrate-binding domain-containing protein [Planctomycetaceae bacterium]|jgi:ABC-type molybdate transport system substrate-binding protein|nr:substrate-binding domain-containing protein [Planctomycetaceae bacterium]
MGENRLVKAIVFCVFSVVVFGCAKEEKPALYIYCSETFWYVMQEECIVFHEIYGFKTVMIPVRGKLTEEESAGMTAEQTDSESVPAPAAWRSSPNRNAASGGKAGRTVQTEMNEDIKNQLNTLAVRRFGNIFLSDSQNQINKLRQLALISGEPSLCHLTLTLLTATDNPKQLTSAKSVLDGQYTLGIVDPAIDGLGEASWNIVTKIISEKAASKKKVSDAGSGHDAPPENLRQFSRQYELLEALESGEIDAALVWNTASVKEFLLLKYAEEFNQMFAPLLDEAKKSKNRERIRSVLKFVYDELMDEKIFGEEVSIVNNPNERCVISVPIIVMTTSETIGYSQRFADFLISNEGKAVLRKFGFSP